MKRLFQIFCFFVLLAIVICKISGCQGVDPGSVGTSPYPTLPGLTVYSFDGSNSLGQTLGQSVESNHVFTFLTQDDDDFIAQCSYGIPNFFGGFLVVPTKFGGVTHVPGEIDPLNVLIACGINIFQTPLVSGDLNIINQDPLQFILDDTRLNPPQNIQDEIASGEDYFVLITNDSKPSTTGVSFLGPFDPFLPNPDQSTTFYVPGLKQDLENGEDIKIRFFRHAITEEIEQYPIEVDFGGAMTPDLTLECNPDGRNPAPAGANSSTILTMDVEFKEASGEYATELVHILSGPKVTAAFLDTGFGWFPISIPLTGFVTQEAPFSVGFQCSEFDPPGEKPECLVQIINSTLGPAITCKTSYDVSP